jgi:tRNA/tmRNA/rRNA uracil-C5-methylase (TrmA/RlmC/RlmD family)
VTVDLAALAKLAAEATPETAGRWRYRRSIFPQVDRINYGYVEWGKRDEGYGTGTLTREMARFIAAASPDVVAALVRVAEAARAYVLMMEDERGEYRVSTLRGALSALDPNLPSHD